MSRAMTPLVRGAVGLGALRRPAATHLGTDDPNNDFECIPHYAHIQHRTDRRHGYST
jgi:hypothetical protein